MTHSAAPATSQDIETAVGDRYAAAAQAVEAALCCPTSYDPKYLDVIPDEVIERDYGCGDPSRYLAEGETVLDLGSGTGKICFIASQVVGRKGRVLGVDMTDEMLGLARRAASEVSDRLGYGNVSFHKARIQDLRLDRDWLDEHLAAHPVAGEQAMRDLDLVIEQQRAERPLIEDDSVDVVVSNCVLNLVRPQDKAELLSEIYRVLRRGGRAVISDIVADEDIPASLQADPELWSGCLSGAFREDRLLAAFEDAGFHGIAVLERQAEPWQVVQGIEFRSLTIAAYKGKEGPCLERGQAVIYRGPFREVLDDDGHRFPRGAAVAVCDKTYQVLQKPPYQGSFTPLEPADPVPLDEAKPFPSSGEVRIRPASDSKASGAGSDCSPGEAAGPSCC